MNTSVSPARFVRLIYLTRCAEDFIVRLIFREVRAFTGRWSIMALEKLEALESRVRGLVEVIQDLKRTNVALQGELRAMRERVMKQEELGRRWEEERGDVKARIEKVLNELDFLDCLEESKEVALD